MIYTSLNLVFVEYRIKDILKDAVFSYLIMKLAIPTMDYLLTSAGTKAASLPAC